MKYSFEWRKWCTFSSLSWPSWYSMSILWADWTATPLHWVQIVGWRKIEQNRILYLQTYFDCWCNWRVLSSCYLLGPLAHPGPGIWPFPSPQQILSPRDGLLQVQIRPSLKSLENCPWVPWHKESHSVKRISATLIDWKLIQGQGIWMSSGRNILNVILKKYTQTGLVKCPETSIHLLCHSWLLEDKHILLRSVLTPSS